MTNVTKIESLMEQYDDAMSDRNIPLCKLLKAEIELLVTLDHVEALAVNRIWDARNASTKAERLSAETGFPIAECLSELEADEDDYFAARARLRSYAEEAHAEALAMNRNCSGLY